MVLLIAVFLTIVTSTAAYWRCLLRLRGDTLVVVNPLRTYRITLQSIAHVEEFRLWSDRRGLQLVLSSGERVRILGVTADYAGTLRQLLSST